MDEPSIYDYLKSLFTPGGHIDFHTAAKKETDKITGPELQPEVSESVKPSHALFVIGSLFAFLGQYFLEPDHKQIVLAVVLYLVSAILILRSRTRFYIAQKQVHVVSHGIEIKPAFLLLSFALQIAAFICFAGNSFTILNVSLWVGGIILLILAFRDSDIYKLRSQSKVDWKFLIVAVLIVCAAVFMRVYQLAEVPGEMYSDHAEKLLDIMDIINGKYSIFFERNTGREPIQFYVTAFIIKVFKTGFTFNSLKIGTVAFGLLTLPFIYLLGKEVGNKWVGLASLFLAGVAYWPNVISRVGLRYSLYPLFTAPTIYFLFKGIREKDINAILLTGIFTGLGLLGYSSFRIVPILIIFAILLFFLSSKNRANRLFTVNSLMLIGLVAFAVFLPLMRYWFDNPGALGYRSMTRLTQVEKPFDEPALIIFMKNAISSLLMPFLNNGYIWVHSIPGRPALDFVSGAFYFVGIISSLKNIRKGGNTEISILLLSIFFLMLPSILSLAYPGENPSLNRSAAAYIPIFIFTGFGFYAFISSIVQLFKRQTGKWLSAVAALFFAAIILANNYNLVFNEYNRQFLQNAWNTTEIGSVIGDFLSGENGKNDAYVIPYPYWVDTRLVGFNAGYPGVDFALWRDDIKDQVDENRNNLFIYKPEDDETGNVLEDLYPDGELSVFYSRILGKEFFIYTVLEK